MRWFFRCVVLNLVAGSLLAYFHPMEVKPLAQNVGVGEVAFMIWIIVSIVVSFYWLIYIFYHWKRSKFKNRKLEKLWFFVLVAGLFYFVGPLIYYFFVYEAGWTLCKKEAF